MESNIVEGMSPKAFNAAREIFGSVINRSGESETSDYQTLKLLIQKYPDLASTKSFQIEYQGTVRVEYPLFAFASKRVGLNWFEHMELLEIVYDVYPEAIECVTSDGHLPLHIVCDKDLPPRIILFFLNKYPEAAAMKHMEGGWTPLDYYLMRPNPLKDIVKAFVEAAPIAIEHKYSYERDAVSSQVVHPSPLCIALCKNCDDSILNLLIPTNPESPCLVFEHEFEHDRLNGAITVERAELIATGVVSWIETLQLDIKWFSQEGLAAFFSTVAKAQPQNLKLLYMHISTNAFRDHAVRSAFSELLQHSPNLESIRVGKPDGETGPSNDDFFLSALASGVKGHPSVREIALRSIRGSSFASLREIMANLESILFADVPFTHDGVQSLVHGIRGNITLRFLQIDHCKMPSGELNSVLEDAASHPTLSVLRLAPRETEDLSALSQLTNLQFLTVEMDSNGCLHERGPTNSLLALLETSTNLNRLDISHLHVPPRRLSGVLKRNKSLEFLKIHGCSDVNDMAKEIALALRESNATLLDVEVQGDDELAFCFLQQLQYYTMMNTMGRDRVMHAETANVSDLVQILLTLSEADSHSHHLEWKTSVVRYGILRESPSLWSGLYNSEAAAEDQVALAIEEDESVLTFFARAFGGLTLDGEDDEEGVGVQLDI